LIFGSTTIFQFLIVKVGSNLHPGSEGVNDDYKAVEGDDGQGEGRDVDGDALREGEECAQDVAEQPLPGERLQRGERDGKETHYYVRDGQVEDEEVGNGVHVPVPDDDDRDKEVAEESEAEDDGVKESEAELNRQLRDQLLIGRAVEHRVLLLLLPVDEGHVVVVARFQQR
jgi:hypothetical protein